MSWLVRLQNESGKALVDHDIEVPFRMLDNLPDDATMLKGVDKHYDTTFNSTQLRFVLSEWQELQCRLTDSSDVQSWQAVLEWLKLGTQKPHVYVKFIGQ